MKTLYYSIIVIVALSMISTIVPHASAHGICTGLQSRYGRLDGVALSNQTLQTGSTLIVSGKIVSSATNNMTGLFRIWSNSTTIGVWEVVSKEPYGYKINISPNDVTPFSITIKALKPGSYRISPQIYFGDLGAISLSDGCHREPKVVVTGNSIPLPNLSPLKQFESGIAANDVKCMSGFQLILKSEDGTPACVKSGTINVLIERGWAKPELYYVDSHVSPKVVLYDHFYDGIDKDNTTVSINNQTYYQTTLNYTVDNLRKNTSIQFHGVIFAFPEGIMVTPGQYDNT
ncbi:MAG: hypothetical protein PXX83_09355 [Candidatus Nitrosotalea sp.]|nr:hypothetical protein [Candidatus Nitrosotalea sp.]